MIVPRTIECSISSFDHRFGHVSSAPDLRANKGESGIAPDNWNSPRRIFIDFFSQQHLMSHRKQYSCKSTTHVVLWSDTAPLRPYSTTPLPPCHLATGIASLCLTTSSWPILREFATDPSIFITVQRSVTTQRPLLAIVCVRCSGQPIINRPK